MMNIVTVQMQIRPFHRVDDEGGDRLVPGHGTAMFKINFEEHPIIKSFEYKTPKQVENIRKFTVRDFAVWLRELEAWLSSGSIQTLNIEILATGLEMGNAKLTMRIPAKGFDDIKVNVQEKYEISDMQAAAIKKIRGVIQSALKEVGG